MTDNEPTVRAAPENLREMIFPGGPARDGRILRLRHVASWESQFLGIGRVAALATDRLLTERHAVDDAGPTVIHLQRHRVEIGLKLILERARASVQFGHKLAPLVTACARACAAAGRDDDWTIFEAGQGEYLDLMDDVDPDSMTFRYPVDRSNEPWQRAGLADLAALEAAGGRYEQSVLMLVAELADLEPLPDMADPAGLHTCLLELARGARDFVAFSQQSLAVLKAQHATAASWSGRPPAQTARGQQAEAAAGDVAQGTLELAQRAEVMALRIATAHDLGDSRPPRPARALPPAPALHQPVLPQGAEAHLEATITWFVDAFVPHIRRFSASVHAARDATRGWDEPVASQLHRELARMASRLSKVAADSERGTCAGD